MEDGGAGQHVCALAELWLCCTVTCGALQRSPPPPWLTCTPHNGWARRWSCETDGYDDDSNPLPAYRDKFDAFRWRRRECAAPHHFAAACCTATS